jgi:hypothetical protein
MYSLYRESADGMRDDLATWYRRYTNLVEATLAHVIAQDARRPDTLETWTEDLPPKVLELLDELIDIYSMTAFLRASVGAATRTRNHATRYIERALVLARWLYGSLSPKVRVSRGGCARAREHRSASGGAFFFSFLLSLASTSRPSAHVCVCVCAHACVCVCVCVCADGR